MFASPSTNAPVLISMAIPADVDPVTTRMRVSMRFGESPEPCGTFPYGEVEDYTVNITTSAAPQAGQLDLTANIDPATAMTVYPNPTNDLVNIELKGMTARTGELMIQNQQGQLIHQQAVDLWETSKLSLNLDEKQLPAGTYFIQFQSAEEVYTTKLILID